MKQMKKLLCGLLMVCMVLTGIGIMPQTVQAKTASGNDGEIHWEIKGDTLTLSAVKGTKGRMKDYSWGKWSPWCQSKQMENVKNIFIKDGITKLGTYAFFHLSEINNNDYSKTEKVNYLSIAGSVKEIPSDFCYYWINTISFNEGIGKISGGAFLETATKKIFVAKSVKDIDINNFVLISDPTYSLVSVYGYKDTAAEYFAEELTKCCNDTQYGYNKYKQDFFYDGKITKTEFIAVDDNKILSKAKAPSSFSVNKGKSKALKITLPAGFTQVAKYTGSPADVKVTFKSSNPKVAKVSSSGKVTGKKKGTAKISISMQIKNGAKKTLTTKVTVK